MSIDISILKYDEFLRCLREIPNISRACKISGLGYGPVKHRYRTDPVFAEQWDEAIAEGVEALEAECLRRGFEGYPGRPVVSNGMVIADVTEYSDGLAMFMLKAHAPHKYKDKSEVTHNGGVTIKVVSGVPDVGTDLA